ncbi:sensor histidine kinase [Halopenitus persicus]|uniref:sensor histidine kinase n=1 Tax=Halopenitus persicus TaxID=1048396 RepID=UPI001E5D9F54|nr:PAS domain-containing sensor histidine kinase [Halopenitus persicus]
MTQRLSTISPRALETLPVELAILDSDGTIVLVNDAWRRFADENHGVDPDYWVGRDYLAISERAYDDPDVAAIVDGLRAILGGSDEPLDVEYPCHSPDRQRWFRMEAVGFDHGGGRYATVIHYDITERKLAELAATSGEHQLKTILAVLTHDIRNPLTVIDGYAELLGEELDETEKTEIIRRAAKRIAEIAEATVEFTRSSTLTAVEPVRVSELAEAAWTGVATADATLAVHRTPTIHGDRRLLLQLLENLFRNAVAYAGPDCTVTVGPLEDGFYVEDDGPGIPEPIRERALEADFSTGGTGGLGLPIVASIARAHGGKLRITDGRNGGARFEITGIDDVAP